MLQILPDAFGTLRAPAAFPVSAVAGFNGCGLKLLCSTREWRAARLISGPEAAIGTAIHRIYERWAAHLGGDDPNLLFEAEIQAAKERLSSDPRSAHFADLPATRSFVEWRNLRIGVKARCRALPRRARPSATAFGEGPERMLSAIVKEGSEVSMIVPSLRLVGRPDRVENHGPIGYLIRDFKTGRAIDSDGRVLPSVAFQLRLYGLMIESLAPRSGVTLILDANGEEHEVPWDETARAETVLRLNRAVDGLPVDGAVMASQIAHAGEECLRCPIRHRCRRYLETAPRWWMDHPLDLAALPTDIWGRVDKIEFRDDQAFLTMTDGAGRSVQVNRLRHRSRMESLRGRMIYIFNLEKSGAARGWTGRPFHPHTFQELPEDLTTKRAWSTEVFVDAL